MAKVPKGMALAFLALLRSLRSWFTHCLMEMVVGRKEISV